MLVSLRVPPDPDLGTAGSVGVRDSGVKLSE